MNITRFADIAVTEFFGWGSVNAYPRDPLRYIKVLDTVQGITTPSTMHMLNCAVQCLAPGECYLEVGTWRGATLIGALLGNGARGIAIDNDTMDDHDGDERASADVWRENITKAGMRKRARYISATVPAVFDRGPALTDRWPVGVYFYDGGKDTIEEVTAGLLGIVPYLAKTAILFVDDGNVMQIRRGIFQFVRRVYPHSWTVLDLPTPGNCWPCFWNGLVALSWEAEP